MLFAAVQRKHGLHTTAVPSAHQDALYVLVRHAAVGYYLYQFFLREELEL
jgi:hypothetical protein